MCQTNRFPSVPRNLICCQSPVIKWSSCLTHRHSSNTPSCLRAFPNWDCWQDSGWPHGNHEPPLDIPCVRLPRGALLSTEKHSPEQKQDQTHARVGGAEPSTLGERGARELQGRLSGVRRSWGGWTFWDVAQTSSPRVTWISASSL